MNKDMKLDTNNSELEMNESSPVTGAGACEDVIVGAAEEGIDAVFFGGPQDLVDSLGGMVVQHLLVALGALVRKARERIAADAEAGYLCVADASQSHEESPFKRRPPRRWCERPRRLAAARPRQRRSQRRQRPGRRFR